MLRLKCIPRAGLVGLRTASWQSRAVVWITPAGMIQTADAPCARGARLMLVCMLGGGGGGLGGGSGSASALGVYNSVCHLPPPVLRVHTWGLHAFLTRTLPARGPWNRTWGSWMHSTATRSLLTEWNGVVKRWSGGGGGGLGECQRAGHALGIFLGHF